MIEARDWTVLGRSDIRITRLGIGTWAWGDKSVWGFGRGYGENEVRQAWQASIKAGINFYDTAEVYGLGLSEKLLGRFLRESAVQPAPVIATKFVPLRPWKGALKSALKASLKRLGLNRVDLYQIHIPNSPLPLATWADALADAVEVGLTRTVGVSNYSTEQMKRAYDALAKRGVALASNQVEFSLLHRRPEQNGLLKTCRELGVTLIAYSPIAMGLLTGKYTRENPPPGARGRRCNRDALARLPTFIELLREIGAAHGGRLPEQVALNWCILKETVPIVGVKNSGQVANNTAALGWRLTEQEVARLDEATLELQGMMSNRWEK